MKRLVATFVIAGFIGVGAVVWGQGQGINGNPFWDRSDTGEIVHVLPTPAAIHSGRDTGPSYAIAGDEPAIYDASYGSGDLSNHGGPQIPNAKFYPIFWNETVANSGETSNGYTKLEAQIVAFVGAFSKSSSYTVIQQYGTSGTPIDNAIPAIGSYHAGRAAKSAIKDSEIRTFLAGLFSSGQLPADETGVYGVYFPAGMKVQLQGNSCTNFCGYHSYFTYGSGSSAKKIKYAAFPYLNCSACKMSATSIVADMLTIVTSHEIREAVTDPQLNSWFDNAGYEADDKCAWHHIYQMPGAGFVVQPEYSNAVSGCVVPSDPKPHHTTKH